MNLTYEEVQMLNEVLELDWFFRNEEELELVIVNNPELFALYQKLQSGVSNVV